LAGVVALLVATPLPAHHGNATGPSLDIPALSDLLAEEVALTNEADTVVTATRYAQRVDRTPSNVTVISREEIEALAPKHAADLLRFVPGLAVLRRQQLGSEIGAVGTGGQAANKVLVLLDGHRMTEPGFGSIPWADLPIVVDELERVEIVFGPESAVYGTNAFAAVVNFITRSSGDVTRRRLRVAAGTRGYTSVTGHVRDRTDGGHLSAVVQVEGRGGFGPMVDSTGAPDTSFPGEEDITRRVARVSHQLELGEGQRLRYSLAATQARIGGVPHIPAVPTTTSEEHRGTYLSADYERELGPQRSLSLRSSFSRLERQLGAAPLRAFGIQESTLDSSLGDLELRLRHRWGAWSVVTGATSRRVKQVGYLTSGQDDDSITSAVFAQGERNFGKRFVLYLGARQVFQDLADDELSWQVAGLYRPRPHTAWRLGLGTSFRQPDFITDRLITANTVGGQPLNSPAFQSNPAVQSEVAREFLQLGWERRWSRATLSVDGYTARLERRIDIVPFGPPVTTLTAPVISLGRPGLRFENAATAARVRGLTIAGERRLGIFRLRSTVTFQDVDGVPGSVEAPYAPHQVGSVQVLLPASPERRWSGALSLHGVSAVDVDPNALVDGAPPRLPGWTTTDLSLTRRLSSSSRMTLGIRDLFDTQRREMIYSFVGDTREQGVRFGREFWLGVTFDL
jgi:outer membrane cobalamin receptor